MEKIVEDLEKLKMKIGNYNKNWMYKNSWDSFEILENIYTEINRIIVDFKAEEN